MVFTLGLLKWMEDFLKNRIMRTTIGQNVMSGVLQGSLLTLTMFAIYINDMLEGANSYMSADDAEVMRRVEKEKDCFLLQRDLNTENGAGLGKSNLTPKKTVLLNLKRVE